MKRSLNIVLVDFVDIVQSTSQSLQPMVETWKIAVMASLAGFGNGYAANGEPCVCAYPNMDGIVMVPALKHMHDSKDFSEDLDGPPTQPVSTPSLILPSGLISGSLYLGGYHVGIHRH